MKPRISPLFQATCWRSSTARIRCSGGGASAASVKPSSRNTSVLIIKRSIQLLFMKAPGYAWYVVSVLTLVYVFSFIDRQILSLLVTPIRRDLGIGDTGMSVLMGFSFAVFYTFFGILLGRLADTTSRRNLIAGGFALWSLFTAGCGLVRNFAQMLVMRVGVGVGEASLSPAAYSLITDYFPRDRLATAISVYSMGIYIGSGLAYLLGGIVVGVASARELWMLPIV